MGSDVCSLATQLPDPYYGANAARVPDIFHAGRGYYTFFFATRFDSPSAHAVLWRYALHFRGVNYAMRAWLNGEQLALDGPYDAGMYLPKRADATAQLLPAGAPVGTNTLCLLVTPPPHVGNVDWGGQGGDHALARDVTMQATQGWDWTAPVADRNTGIYLPVTLECSGGVYVHEVWVATAVGAGPPISAALSVSARVSNAGDAPREVALAVDLLQPGDDARWALLILPTFVTLAAGETREVQLADGVALDAPQLWWPVGLGAQALYTARVTATLRAEPRAVSHTRSQRFGLRSLEVPADAATGGRAFFINGVRCFIRGANYIASDLRLQSTGRVAVEVRLLAEAGLNMVRVWGGAAAESDDFYDACDERGLLVWQDLWITGDCNGRGANGASPPEEEAQFPDDHALWLASADALVRRLRSRPCLALWCGGNEQRPPADIDAAFAASLADVDPGRLYIPGSLWSGFGAGDGSFSDGPYVCHELEDIWRDDFYPHAFNPEVGATCVPVADSVRRTFPDAADAAPPAVLPDGTEAPNSAWIQHCFQAHDGGADRSVRNQLLRFGPLPAGDLDAYCLRSQIVGYEQTRALLEAWGSRLGRPYTGMLLWKAHNPWPGLRSALYDYWHDVGGGYGAALAVTRRGIHVQLNAATRRVELVNTRAGAVPSATLTAVAVRLDGSVAWKMVAASPALGGFTAAECDVTVPPAPGGADVVFLRLMLLPHSGGAALCRNVYWQNAPGVDLSALEAWRRSASSRVKLTLLAPPGADGKGGAVRVANVSPRVAFFIRLSIRRAKPPPSQPQPVPLWRALLQALRAAFASPAPGDVLVTHAQSAPLPDEDDRVLPVFWSDAFITLLPGEAMDVSFAHAPLSAPTRLEASGWNVLLASVPVV